MAAEVEGDPPEVDIYSIPQADVILIVVGGERPNNAIVFTLRIQAKDRGTGIALVLPNMSYQNLRGFHTYAGSWSLISAAACGDQARLGAVLEAAGRGIPRVDTAISRLLEIFEHGTVDFNEEFDEDAISHLIREPEPALKTVRGSALDSMEEALATWIGNPSVFEDTGPICPCAGDLHRRYRSLRRDLAGTVCDSHF